MPVVLFLRLLGIAYGRNEPPRGEKVRIDLTRPPTNAGDFRWLAEQVDRIARKLDAVHEGREELDEETWRWLVEFFGRRHIPARDPDREGFPLDERRHGGEQRTPLDALEAEELHRKHLMAVEALYAIASPAQRKICDGIREGLKPVEIARRSGISRKTVSTQLARLLQKISPKV